MKRWTICLVSTRTPERVDGETNADDEYEHEEDRERSWHVKR